MTLRISTTSSPQTLAQEGTRGAKKALKAYTAQRADSDQFTHLHGDELGWRLAGLIDGEGCFHIAHHKPRFPGHRCVFTIAMRADDRDFLKLIHASTGIGRLYESLPRARTLARRPGTKPQVRWQVEGLVNCLRLVVLLDKYPPLSKKGQDYAIWREAVEAWVEADWQRMAELRAELMSSRAFLNVNHHVSGVS